MGKLTCLPSSFSGASVVSVYDYGNETTYSKTIQDIVNDFKAIDQSFNTFMFAGFSDGRLAVFGGFNQPNTPYIANDPYIQYDTGYTAGFKRYNNMPPNITYVYWNGELQYKSGYGISWYYTSKDGVDYATIWRPSNWTSAIVACDATTLYVNGQRTTVKDWKAWELLSGNNGQYRCNLTTLKQDSIGSLSGQTSGTNLDFDRISGQSDIWSIFLNTPYDTETTVAWSGDAYLTLTLHDVVGQPTKTEFVFKFYSNQDSLLFTISFTYGTGGEYPDKNVYLSFVYDDESQTAAFIPIQHSASGTYYWGYDVSALTENDLLYVWMWLQMSGSPDPDPLPDNPYDTGSEDNGGGGGNPRPQDDITVGGNPVSTATTSGMFTCYMPTESELEDIADFLWSTGVLDNARKYFNNFADNIIALYNLPYSPVNPPTKQFKVGGLEVDGLANVKYVSTRFVDVDMGSYVVEPRWTSYLDYAPYTKMEIYLPGIGMQALDTDEIMSPADKNGVLKDPQGSTLSLLYKIDLLTGVCVAYVKVNGKVRYQFPGKLGFSIPITGQDYGRIITGFTTVAAGVAGGIAYGGIAAPLKSQAIGHLVGGEVSAAVAGTVNAMKPEVHRSGNLSCEVSSISEPTPYLVITSPNKPMLVNQEVFTGLPSYKSGVLSDFDGYTECIDAHVEGISCTEEERNMIIEWLRKGVIL